MTMPAAEIPPRFRRRQKLRQPLTIGLDHIGLTVADLDRSIVELKSFFGGGRCYLEGPILDPEPGWMQRKLGAKPGQFRLHVAAVRVADFNLELFYYRPIDGQPQQKCHADQAFFALLHACHDPEEFLKRHAGRLRHVRHTSTSWIDIETRSGLRLLLHKAEDAFVLPAIVLGAEQAGRMLEETRTDFGLRVLHRLAPPFGNGTVLRGPQGSRLAVISVSNLKGPPANSDIGGFHLAFHADDVDQSAAALAATGYQVMGTPETISGGPIAGDRWVYLRSPSEIQMEVINMPDRRLPYEAKAAFFVSRFQERFEP